MNSDKLIALAQRLIKKNGRVVELQKLTRSNTSDKPWKENTETYISEDSVEVDACFIPASSDFGENVVSTELISRVDQVALIAPTTVDIKFHNVVIDRNKQWKIDWVQVLDPADKPLLYVVGLKS